MVVGNIRDKDTDLDPMRKWTSASDVQNDTVVVREFWTSCGSTASRA